MSLIRENTDLMCLQVKNYEPKFNIDNNSYEDECKFIRNESDSTKIFRCSCSNKIITCYSNFHLHIKQKKHQFWLKNIYPEIGNYKKKIKELEKISRVKDK